MQAGRREGSSLLSTRTFANRKPTIRERHLGRRTTARLNMPEGTCTMQGRMTETRARDVQALCRRLVLRQKNLPSESAWIVPGKTCLNLQHQKTPPSTQHRARQPKPSSDFSLGTIAGPDVTLHVSVDVAQSHPLRLRYIGSKCLEERCVYIPHLAM